MNEKYLKASSIISTVVSFIFLVAAFYIPSFYQVPKIVDEMYKTPAGLRAIIASLSVKNAQLELTNILNIGFIFFLGVAVSLTLFGRISALEKK